MSVSNSTNPLPPRLPDVRCRVYWKYIGSKKRNVILRTRIKIIFWCERFLVPSSTLKRIHSVICMVLWHLVRVLNQGKTFYPPPPPLPPLFLPHFTCLSSECNIDVEIVDKYEASKFLWAIWDTGASLLLYCSLDIESPRFSFRRIWHVQDILRSQQ